MILYQDIYDGMFFPEFKRRTHVIEPFDIPDNWTWIRQKNICWLDNGIKTCNEKLPYLEAKVIRGSKEPILETSGIVVDSTKKVILVDGENSGEIMTPP